MYGWEDNLLLKGGYEDHVTCSHDTEIDKSEGRDEMGKTGIIGFFDILGYGNMMRNNNPEVILNNIIRPLTNIGEFTADKLNKLANTIPQEEQKIDVKAVCSEMEWIVFADSILITLETGENTKESYNKWFVFIAACLLLDQNTFINGIPLRGAVNYGDYLTYENSFAGKGIIDAYELGESVDLSVLVLSDEAVTELQKLEQFGKLLDSSHICQSIISISDGDKRKYVVATNKTFHSSETVEDTVYRSFGDHNKDLPSSVMGKLNNTIKHQYYIKHRNM